MDYFIKPNYGLFAKLKGQFVTEISNFKTGLCFTD